MDETNRKKTFWMGFLAGIGAAALAGLLLYSGGMLSQPVQGPSPSSLAESREPEIPPVVAEPAGPLEESSRPPESAPEESSAGEPSSSSAPPSGREVIGEFAVLRDSDLINELADEHLELIYHYFDRSYRSLSTLKAEDLLDLFSPRTDEEYENSILNQLSLQMLCGVRAVRENDLRLDRYRYGIRITAFEEKSSDCVTVDLVEDSEVHFTFLDDGVDSNTSGVQHRFVLVRDAAGDWYIGSHDQDEDFTQQIWAKYLAVRGASVLTDHDRVNAIFYDLYDKMLSAAEQDEQSRQEQQGTARVDARLPANQYTWKHEYDRDTAVGYSYLWVDGIKTLRNNAWQIYGQNGTNYVSQSLYAGGIPMDCTGSQQWKWCGDTVNTSQMMIGRSTSWTDVDAFYLYARSNEKGGPVTLTDGNIFSVRPGDVLQLGLFDSWYQSVLIAETISGPDGSPIDLLINTNTTDRIDYPASALLATNLRAIRVLGFN